MCRLVAAAKFMEGVEVPNRILCHPYVGNAMDVQYSCNFDLAFIPAICQRAAVRVVDIFTYISFKPFLIIFSMSVILTSP